MNEAIVVFDDTIISSDVLALRPDINLKTGEQELVRQIGQLTTIETDLLVLAASIYGCDLAFKRGDGENFGRQIQLTVPVINLALFNQVHDQLIDILYILSSDNWEIAFCQRNGVPEVTSPITQDNYEKLLLFSGGLDSFSAAIKLAQEKNHIRLISHTTGNHVIQKAQEELKTYLDIQYPGKFTRIAVRVGCTDKATQGYPFPSVGREDTQRTRSFLFLSMAGISARHFKIKDVIMIAENGQMAIHLPLTSSRIGAFSTHTAHPEFVSEMENLLCSLLNYKIKVVNPFLYLTKAEVVKEVVDLHLDAVKKTISCWMASRVIGDKHHCGTCVPCLIRRIAIEAHGIRLSEYKRDLFAENLSSVEFDNDGKRNFMELAELINRFEDNSNVAELEMYYPDLLNIHVNRDLAITMYHRFAIEAKGVINSYPNIRSLV